MKNLYLTSLFVAFAALVVACGSNGSPPAITTPQESNRNWTVELSVSGGIAGMHRQLTVDDNGEWHASDRRQGHKSGKLEAEQLTRLNELLATVESAPAPQSGPSIPGRCADCIESKLNAVINGKRYTAATRSGNKPAQPYADLFAQLSMLLQETFFQR